MELKHEGLEDEFPFQRAVFLGSMLRFGETFYLVIATKKLSLLANLEKRIFTPPPQQTKHNKSFLYLYQQYQYQQNLTHSYVVTIILLLLLVSDLFFFESPPSSRTTPLKKSEMPRP